MLKNQVPIVLYEFFHVDLYYFFSHSYGVNSLLDNYLGVQNNINQHSIYFIEFTS